MGQFSGYQWLAELVKLSTIYSHVGVDSLDPYQYQQLDVILNICDLQFGRAERSIYFEAI